MTRNVATIAQAPKQRALPRTEGQSWTATELREFLRIAAGHRHFPILWLAANRHAPQRNARLKWTDIDFNRQRLALDRGLVAIGYEVHQTRRNQERNGSSPPATAPPSTRTRSENRSSES